jgi:hypothetical protein
MAIDSIKLSPQDRRTLEGLKGDIEVLEKEIAKAERAGIDVSTQKDELAKAKSLREGILREYGS